MDDLSDSVGTERSDRDPTQMIWVDLEFRNDRLFGRLQGTDLVVSGRSMRTLRSKVIDVIPTGATRRQARAPRIYWLHDGDEITYVDGVAQWEIYRQSQVDEKARVLRTADGT